MPGLEKNSVGYVLFSGALLGLVCYSTYDLTNLEKIASKYLKPKRLFHL